MLLCDRSLRLLQARGGKGRIDWTGAGLLTAAVSAWLLILSKRWPPPTWLFQG
jgi:hypothetical protein